MDKEPARLVQNLYLPGVFSPLSLVHFLDTYLDMPSIQGIYGGRASRAIRCGKGVETPEMGVSANYRKPGDLVHAGLSRNTGSVVLGDASNFGRMGMVPNGANDPENFRGAGSAGGTVAFSFSR